jgi:DNA-binding response OmpR family regulator
MSEPSDLPWGSDAAANPTGPAEDRPPVGAPSQSASSLDGEYGVLVVDADGVTRRFVELILSKVPGMAVEGAKDATGALEVLRTTPVDLIIADTDLPDMDGLQFHRRLGQESRLKGIPFIFLSADTRVPTRVAALRAGADEYLTKPVEAAELTCRAEALIARRRAGREALRNRSFSLAGDFLVMALHDLVANLDIGKRSGTLNIATPRADARLFLDRGQIVHAVFGNLVGSEAFYRLMAEPMGQFEFTPGDCGIDPAARTIAKSATALIMEGARILDAETSGTPSSTPAAGTPAETVKATAGVVSAPAASIPLATQYEVGVRDGFALGELRLWNPTELADWTLAPGGRDRLHVHLVADLAAGISAVMSMAALPTEREMLASLSLEEQAAGLVFYLRNERLIDLVLLDIRAPATFLRALMREPSITIIAPPDGDYQSLGTKARVELEQLVGWLKPTAILGVGNNLLKANLMKFAGLQTEGHLRCQPGFVGEGRADLRALLVEGIRLWALRAPPERTARKG